MGFSSLKTYGNCDVNYVWSKNKGLLENEIDELVDKSIHVPEWNSSTVTLSVFNGGLEASNLSKPITGYLIQRQQCDEDIRCDVTTVDSSVTSICDFNVGSRTLYQYYVIPIYNENDKIVYGEPISTEMVKTDFNSWSVVGLLPTQKPDVYIVDKNNIWNFYVNVSSGTFTINMGKSVTDSLGKFPRVYTNGADYISGSLSCYIGDVSCSAGYEGDDIKLLKRWRNFCNNGCLKLLKDVKGHIIPCEITDASYDHDEEYDILPTTIAFSFVQLDDSDNITAYTTDEIN